MVAIAHEHTLGIDQSLAGQLHGEANLVVSQRKFGVPAASLQNMALLALGLVSDHQVLQAALEVVLPSEEGLDEFVDDLVQLDFILKDSIIGFTGSVFDDWLENVTAFYSKAHVTNLGAHEGTELVDEFGLGLVPELEHVAAVEDLGYHLEHTRVDVALFHDTCTSIKNI